MTSIRKYMYAGLLAFTTLNLMPSMASAQAPVKGTFTLAHDVHWQNAVVPAGEYRFKYEWDGVATVLTLSKISGAPAGFLFLVRDTEEARLLGANRLVLASTAEGSFVSAMKLPEFGVTLNFTVPAEGMEKVIAKAAATAGASAAR
jgi:hypothetical protein